MLTLVLYALHMDYLYSGGWFLCCLVRVTFFLVISNGYLHLSTFCAALQVLDFDFEKFCSISLSNLNVYACLVCGKYFQGRGLKSHAYTHSLEAGHHVFINLQTERAYCLPDGYEINDPSLEDIRHVLNPRCFSIAYYITFQLYLIDLGASFGLLIGILFW